MNSRLPIIRQTRHWAAGRIHSSYFGTIVFLVGCVICAFNFFFRICCFEFWYWFVFVAIFFECNFVRTVPMAFSLFCWVCLVSWWSIYLQILLFVFLFDLAVLLKLLWTISWNMVFQFFGMSSDLFLILKYGFHSGFCFVLLSFHVLLAIFFEIKIVSMAFCLVV